MRRAPPPEADRAASRASCVGWALAAAALLALPMHWETGAALGTFALAPWLAAVSRVPAGTAALSGASLGIAYGAGVALWIPEALRTLGASPAAALAGLLVVCAWAGPPVFVALALVARGSAARSAALRVAALAATAFAVEWVVSRSAWGVPFGLLGHSQRGATGVAQLALVAGVPAISAWLVGLNAALALALAGARDGARLAVALAAGFAALALAGLPLAEWLRPPPDDVPPSALLLVQPDIPRGERWGDALQPANLQRVRSFAARVLAEQAPGVDAILLPENLLTARLDAAPALARALDEAVAAFGVPVLTGLVYSAEAPAPDRYRSAAVWLEPGRGVTARLDKERAIPLLEASRRVAGAALLAPLFGDAARWDKVEEAAAGGVLAGPVPLTPLLCYELLFPDLAARRRAPGSVAIVNLADDSWVAGDSASRQLAGIARFRAIEQRIALVRVAHGGLSLTVDAFGRVVEALPGDRYAARRLSLRPSPPPTAAERAGLLALPLAAAAAAWALAGGAATSWSRSRRRRE